MISPQSDFISLFPSESAKRKGKNRMGTRDNEGFSEVVDACP
jgi:hypothetical protein